MNTLITFVLFCQSSGKPLCSMIHPLPRVCGGNGGRCVYVVSRGEIDTLSVANSRHLGDTQVGTHTDEL